MSTQVSTFTPKSGCLLIKPADPESVTPGGIVLPDNAKKKATRGTVAATNPVDGDYDDEDGEYIYAEFNTGDTVLYKPYAGTEIELDGDTYLIVDTDDVLGRFSHDIDPTDVSYIGD